MAHPKGPALLRQFMEQRGLTLREVGAALGVSHVSVLAWRRRRSTPQDAIREALDRWTAGAVPAESWLTKDDVERRERLAKLGPLTKTEAA